MSETLASQMAAIKQPAIPHYSINDMDPTLPNTPNSLLTLSNAIATSLAQVGESLIAVSGSRRRSVSGIHWRPDIFIAAELGRRPQADSKQVILPNGDTATAEVAGRDPALDLVVLKLANTGIPAITPSKLDHLKVGHLVAAAGRDLETGLSASLGIIGNLDGPWQTMQGRNINALIRPDLNLYPSLLGGALIDMSGQVIGINLIGPRRQVVTLPAETINKVIDALLETGHIRRGYLGIGLQPVELPDSLQTSLALTDAAGLIVINLEPGGPAEQAGILIGDIVIKLDQQPISRLQEVRGALEPEKIGQDIPVQLIRGGQLIERSLTVGVQP